MSGTNDDYTAWIGKTQDPSGAWVYMDKEHWDTHRGNMWGIYNVIAAVDDDPGALYLVKVGSKQLHFSFGAAMIGQEMYLEIFESPTTSADGTQLTAYNKNRDTAWKATALSSTFFHTPTVTGTGTQLDLQYYHESGVGAGASADVEMNYQWVLKRNTNYLLRHRTAAGTGTSIVRLKFYEVAVTD